MFQRTLILAAISAAFAQVPQIDPCPTITEKLQSKFRPHDPYTFPNISNFIYTRDDDNNSIRYNFDFFDLIFKGFSNVRCSSSKGVGRQQVTTLNLTGDGLEFGTNNYRMHINTQQPSGDGQNPIFDLKVRTYALELIFIDEVFTSDPLKLCILRDTFEMTFRAEGMVFVIDSSPPVAQELNDHPEAVLKAINLYISRFDNDLTTKLNSILCPPNPSREDIGTVSVVRPGGFRLPGSYYPGSLGAIAGSPSTFSSFDFGSDIFGHGIPSQK